MTTRFRPIIAQLEPRDVPSRTLFVDDDRRQIPSAAYTTIQAAVNASRPGDDIVVAPGIYREQVNIPATKDHLDLVSQKPGQAVIQAPAVMTDSGTIVAVNGADDVTVRGFTITGPAQVANSLQYGVAVFGGGSAVIRDNTITRIRNAPLDGNQQGIAVLVYGANDHTTASVVNNTITDYQKDGVEVYGVGASASVSDNDIRGIGPTGAIAQNGVVVSGGAKAVVCGNDVSGNVYTGADTYGIGVLVDSATAVVTDNRVTGNQLGVAVFSTTGVVVSGNLVANNTLTGLVLNGVASGLVAGNVVEKNGNDGVLLFNTTGTLVIGNLVRKNGGDGLVLTGATTGNVSVLNTLRLNVGFDAFDDTLGQLTGGTANLWAFNWIANKNVPGLR